MKHYRFTFYLALFVGLSSLDLILTHFLIASEVLGIYEGNPIAAWFLRQFGWSGMIGFKGGCVAVVATAAMIVARLRPQVGARVMAISCSIIGFVIVYSSVLPVAAIGKEAAEDQAIQNRTDNLEIELRKVRQHEAVKTQLIKEMCANKRTFASAADAIIDTDFGRDQSWLEHMRIYYPGCTRAEGMAVCLLRSAVMHMHDQPQASQWIRRWHREFTEHFPNVPLSCEDMPIVARLLGGT